MSYSEVRATSTLTGSGQSLSIPLIGVSGVAVQLTGTWSATLVVEVSPDNGTNYTSVQVLSYGTSTSIAASNITSNGLYAIFPTIGCNLARIRVSAFSSGSIEVVLTGTESPIQINFAQETRLSWSHGAKSSIGTSAVQMNVTSIPALNGVIIKAANLNTGIVYIGNSLSVTAGTVDATDGFELGAGESIQVSVNNVNSVFLIASGAGQKVYWALT